MKKVGPRFLQDIVIAKVTMTRNEDVIVGFVGGHILAGCTMADLSKQIMMGKKMGRVVYHEL